MENPYPGAPIAFVILWIGLIIAFMANKKSIEKRLGEETTDILGFSSVFWTMPIAGIIVQLIITIVEAIHR